MVSTARIAHAARIIALYSSEGINVHHPFIQGGPNKLYIFQHTVFLEPFKVKWNDFTDMFLEFLVTKIRLLC